MCGHYSPKVLEIHKARAATFFEIQISLLSPCEMYEGYKFFIITYFLQTKKHVRPNFALEEVMKKEKGFIIQNRRRLQDVSTTIPAKC